MTNKERQNAIDHIEGQIQCGYVDVGGCHDENEFEIIQEAMTALGSIDQIKWERNVAIAQLEELGIGFGQKIDGVYLDKEEYEYILAYMGQSR